MTREHVSLTIYNQGTSLVRERRRITLQQGANTLDITDVAAQIDATSVTLQAENVTVLEQNYLYDLVGSEALLRRYLEEIIEITTEDGTLFTGLLLSANGADVILQQSDGQVISTNLHKLRNLRFPALPDGLITRPTLRWLLQSASSGEQSVELTYLSDGLNWTADYNLLLAVENTAFDINGWVTLTNTSGATFDAAQVKLVAGDVKRLPQPARTRGILGKIDHYARAEPQVEQREIFEYQLYEVKRPVTVADKETKQVEFVTGTNTPCTLMYIYDAVAGWFSGYQSSPVVDRHTGSETVKIKAWLEFSTSEENGLGEDLPAGRMRVYQADTDGSAVLIGENHIQHTPKGETVRFELGAAFDLVGERKQTDFQQRGKNVIHESYEIKLRNRKDSGSVEIRVHETLFRWRNWEILEASDPYTRQHSTGIEFRVPVAAGEEKIITYTVRYSW